LCRRNPRRTTQVSGCIRRSILGGIANFITHTFDVAANAANGIASSQEAEAEQEQQ